MYYGRKNFNSLYQIVTEADNPSPQFIGAILEKSSPREVEDCALRLIGFDRQLLDKRIQDYENYFDERIYAETGDFDKYNDVLKMHSQYDAIKREVCTHLVLNVGKIDNFREYLQTLDIINKL